MAVPPTPLSLLRALTFVSVTVRRPDPPISASHNLTILLWGTQRIRGELLKLSIAVSARSIRRYRRARHSPPPSQSWLTFLSNHAQGIWAADLLVVQTLTFKTMYVLFFISHGRRERVHFEVTAHPTAARVWRQLIEATPWDRKPRHLIHDRDRVWGTDFGLRPAGLGIQSLQTPFRAPRANSSAERWVRTAWRWRRRGEIHVGATKLASTTNRSA
ncbi:MAG TPA: hypothetical protein VMV09_05490 [Candidatus Saccharimonadales bacterium]|nr:hypothetical protein [Candidatus Saccharimonadales bacterium]